MNLPSLFLSMAAAGFQELDLSHLWDGESSDRVAVSGTKTFYQKLKGQKLQLHFLI